MKRLKLKVISVILILSLVLCSLTSCGNSTGGENANLGDILKNYKTYGMAAWWEILAVYNAGENPVNYENFNEICLSLVGNDYLNMAPYVIIANIAITKGTNEKRFDKFEEYKLELKKFLENPYFKFTINEYIYAYYALKCSGTDFNQTPIFEYFLKEQNSDGGFGFLGDLSDVDTTAMMIPVLQLLYKNDNPNIENDMDMSPLYNAVKFIESQIHENGAFEFYGEENANSTACALSALIAFYKDDGSSIEMIKKASDGLANFRLRGKAAYSCVINGRSDLLATAQAAIALGDLKNKTSVWEKLYLDKNA